MLLDVNLPLTDGMIFCSRDDTVPSHRNRYLFNENKVLDRANLSNTKDESVMFTEVFQQRVAEAIVAGIEEYLK